MADPANYMLNLPNPAAAITSGVEQGMQLGLMAERGDLMKAQQAQALAQRQSALMQAQQTQLENQALMDKQAREKAQYEALDAFYAKKPTERTFDDYERLSSTLPKDMAENVRKSFELKTQEEQKSDLLFGSKVLSAIRLGDTGTASEMLKERAAAYEASGRTAEAGAMKNAAAMALISPERLEQSIGVTLATLPGGKDFIDNIAKQSEMRTKEAMAPGQIAKAIAEGRTAEIIAGTEQKLRDAEIDMKKAQSASARASAGASAANAKKTLREIARIDALEPGEVRKLAAEADKLEAEAREKRGEMSAQGAVDAGQRVLDTVALLRGDTTDAKGKVTRGKYGVLKDIAGPTTSKFPTFLGASADAERAIETLKDQVFLSQIKQMKGMGALSEKEGDRLASSIASLSLAQSPERLQKNIEYIEKTMSAAMEKARTMTTTQGGGAAQAAPTGDVRAQADAILRGGK